MKETGHRSTWSIAPVTDVIYQQENISPMLAHLLAIRGYDDSISISSFLDEPIFEHDPFLIPDMEKAIRKTKRFIKRKEKIAIYGDFDTDGITASAIMYEALKQLGVEPEVIIPHRKEGHGIASFRLKELADKGVKLIITVDGGVNAFEEAKEAKSLGMDLIITDHHEPHKNGKLPKCLVVNPIRKDSQYPFKGLSGAGLAYKFVSALFGEEKEDLLDLAALGTVADVMPIRDENRGIVMRGLKLMSANLRLGLATLFEVCEIDTSRLNSATVAFYIAPRINAANRMADPRQAYELMVADDPKTAEKISHALGNLNEKRKSLLEENLSKLLTEVGDAKDFAEQIENDTIAPVITVRGSWVQGLSGLLASRLTDIYGVPTFCASDNNEYGRISASGRSIPGVSIIDILERAQELGANFRKFGGHAGACGFVSEIDQYDKAIECIHKAASEKVEKLSTGSTLRIDAEIPFNRVNMYSLDQLDRLAPFGQGFPEPLFLSRCVKLVKQKQIGVDKNHLSFSIIGNNKTIRGVMFGHDAELEDVSEDQDLDIVYNMEANSFFGYPKPEIRIKDWKFSENCDTLIEN